jgi:hypothetical protein
MRTHARARTHTHTHTHTLCQLPFVHTPPHISLPACLHFLVIFTFSRAHDVCVWVCGCVGVGVGVGVGVRARARVRLCRMVCYPSPSLHSQSAHPLIRMCPCDSDLTPYALLRPQLFNYFDANKTCVVMATAGSTYDCDGGILGVNQQSTVLSAIGAPSARGGVGAVRESTEAKVAAAAGPADMLYKTLARASPSLMWAFPRAGTDTNTTWTASDVLISTKSKQYTAFDVEELLTDLGLSKDLDTWKYLSTEPDLATFDAPGVNTFVTCVKASPVHMRNALHRTASQLAHSVTPDPTTTTTTTTMHTNTQSCTHTHTHAHTHAHNTHAHTRAHAHAHTQTNTNTHTHSHTHTHTHTHTHAHSLTRSLTHSRTLTLLQVRFQHLHVRCNEIQRRL